MTEFSNSFDIDIIMKFHSIDCQLVKITEILLLFTFVNNSDKERLHELNKKKNYELKIFQKSKICFEFFKTLKCTDSDKLSRLYQHTLVILVHFAQDSEKDNFEFNHSSSFLNYIFLRISFDLN